MKLSHGGHLTHGHPITHLANIFDFYRYGIKDVETGEIDYAELRRIAKEQKPKMILAGYSAFPRDYDYGKLKEIADEIGAIAMADVAHIAGLIAAGVMDNPFDYGFQMVTTTTHKSLRGPRGGMILTKGEVGNPLKKPEKKIENLPTLVDRSVFPGLQGGPHMNKVAGIAVALKEAETKEFMDYGKQVLKNAKTLAQKLMDEGCKLVTNGTSNHLILMNTVESFDVTGDVVEKILDEVGLTLNKNTIPDDPNPPYRPSGVRLGTPAATTRGMTENEMEKLGEIIVKTVNHRDDSKKILEIKEEVKDLCSRFPVPAID
jgi:glycine hydroxymethyltransferase